MNKLHGLKENRAPLPSLSADGYIRLSSKKLFTLRFVHVVSDIDVNFLDELTQKDLPAQTAGFSEWVSDGSPTVSVGWGWFIDLDSQRMVLAPDPIRSNVMLIDRDGLDLGPAVTESLFSTWLAIHDWQPSVLSHIRRTLSCHN